MMILCVSFDTLHPQNFAAPFCNHQLIPATLHSHVSKQTLTHHLTNTTPTIRGRLRRNPPTGPILPRIKRRCLTDAATGVTLDVP